jgi:type I restriction enzyme R subunit
MSRARLAVVKRYAADDALMARFPNAAVNADEQRRLRASMYRPLLKLAKDDRGQLT